MSIISRQFSLFISIFVYCIILVVHVRVIEGNKISFKGNVTCARKFLRHNRHLFDLYWVNIDRSSSRRDYMNHMLGFFGFNNHRVSAITPEQIYVPKGLERASDCRTLSENETLTEIIKIKELQDSHQLNRTVLLAGHCGRSKNNDQMKALSCTVSHLVAMYSSIHKHLPRSLSAPISRNSTKTVPSSLTVTESNTTPHIWKKYALIMEDDLRLAFEIDFEKVVASAPEDFVMLQLVTSNELSVEYAWDRYLKTGTKWLKRGEYDASWCTGAYLINKERMKEAIDSIVQKINDKLYVIRVQSVEKKCPQMRSCCSNNSPFPDLPCVLSPYGYEADNFLYNLVFGKTYVSAIPFFLTSDVAQQSTLHAEHVEKTHASAFTMMKNLIQYMLETDPKLMPSYINPSCARECHELGIFCLNQTTNSNPR